MIIVKACQDIYRRWTREKPTTRERRDILFLINILSAYRTVAKNAFIQYGGLNEEEAKSVVDLLIEQELKRKKIGRKYYGASSTIQETSKAKKKKKRKK